MERNYGPNDFWYARGMFAGSLLDYSHFFRLGRTVAYQRKYEPLRSTTMRRATSAGRTRPTARVWRSPARILIQFARQVEADGATPVVVLFGRKSDVVAMRHNEKGLRAAAPAPESRRCLHHRRHGAAL